MMYPPCAHTLTTSTQTHDSVAWGLNVNITKTSLILSTEKCGASWVYRRTIRAHLLNIYQNVPFRHHGTAHPLFSISNAVPYFLESGSYLPTNYAFINPASTSPSTMLGFPFSSYSTSKAISMVSTMYAAIELIRSYKSRAARRVYSAANITVGRMA